MAFPMNHKTVFVMDHGPSFAMPCELIDLDVKPHGTGHFDRLTPINKFIWSSATESVLEYVRLVYDIFPPDTDELKLLKIVVADSDLETQVLNTWKVDDQNSSSLCAGLSKVGPPEMGNMNFDLRFGLTKGLEALCELTPTQQKYLANPDKEGTLINRGRIVLLTQVQNEQKLRDLFFACVASVNRFVSESENFAPLDEVQLDVIHCYSNLIRDKQPLYNRTYNEASLGASIHIFSVPAGVDLAKKMLCLALRHYDLASTTVTGIPMKEEQNASSSANYDVELFHKASAHTKLFSLNGYSATAPVDLQSWMPQTMKEGSEYKTVTLKWCTPRGNSLTELQHCITATRITPTDVNSRPSSCLTNFLLSGRSVMLEMPRRSGSKILSHMLTSHAGEIFIHTLAVARSVLEDPPPITDVPGGRVTDYRIGDLGELMKQNRLAPFYGESKAGVPDPLDIAAKRLGRFAIYCPQTVSSTTILNMATITPLYNVMIKEELTEENIVECKKVIYSLMSMENKGDPLPVPIAVTSSKSKTMKKDDQYKMMFAELERFLTVHGRTEKHLRVLDCFLEVRNKLPAPRNKDLEKGDHDSAKRDIDRYSSRIDNDDGPQRAALASLPPTKRPKICGQSLLDIVRGRIEKENNKSLRPYAGMTSVGEKAKLYLSLEKKESKEGTPTPMDM